MARFFIGLTALCLISFMVGCGETPITEEAQGLDVSTPKIEFGDPVGVGSDNNEFEATNTTTDNTDTVSGSTTDVDSGEQKNDDNSFDVSKVPETSSLEFSGPENSFETGEESD